MTLEATRSGPRPAAFWTRFNRTPAGGWVALAARLGLAAVWLVSGLHTLTDLSASVRTVSAYQLFPYPVAVAIGSAQPVIETLLGIALVVGIAIRLIAAISGVAFLIFIAGIASVWARGLRIDCGCFSSGGALGSDQPTTYGWDILRDVGFLVLALLVFLLARSRFSLDSRLFYLSDGRPTEDDADSDEDDSEQS